MWMLAQGFDWGFLNNTANLAIVLAIGLAGLSVVCTAVVKVVRARENAALKARLIERGASAAEIREILEAGADKGSC
ncbi:hypothetical protein [Mucisphaera sp.]|uniref:hypothetical protein n=1 Tax=Mucisphaera sp. TaxID=2913024 RepID=UPI003D138724